MKRRIQLAGALSLTALLAASIGYMWHGGVAYRNQLVEMLPVRQELTSPALSQAVESARERVARKGNLRDSLNDMASLYHSNEYTEQAIICYELLLQVDPNNAKWSHRIASALSDFGRTEAAIARYRETVFEDPTYLPARWKLAESLFKSGKLAESKTAYAEALKLAPKSVPAQLGLARLEVNERNWEAAKDNLESVIKNSQLPPPPAAMRLLSVVYRALGEEEKALIAEGRSEGQTVAAADPWIDELMTYCFDAYRLTVEASNCEHRGNETRALELLKKAIEVNPGNSFAHKQLGVLLGRLGKSNAARHHFEQAVALAPEDSDHWLSYLQHEEHSGTLKSQLSVIDRGLKAAPDSYGLHLKKGRYLLGNHQHKTAILYFKKAVEIRPHEITAYLPLAHTYVKIGLNAQGEATLLKAFQIDPDNPIALSMYARLAVQFLETETAQEFSKRALFHPYIPDNEKAAITRAMQRRGI